MKTITYSDIINFKAWSKANFKMKPLLETCYGKKVNKDKVYFQVSGFFEFIFDPDKQGEVLCRPFIGNEMSNEKFVLLKTKGCCADIPTLEEFPAYSTKVRINPLKMNDLEKLKQYVPEEFEIFYKNILQWPTAANIQEEVEEDF